MTDFLGFAPGSTIVVTGGGSGIGAALVTLAARHGLNVSSWDTNQAGAEQVADAVARTGDRPHVAVVDVSDADAVEQAWQEVTRRFGPVSYLANVAGPPSFAAREFMSGVDLCVRCMRTPTEAWLRTGPGPGPDPSAVYFASMQGPYHGSGVDWYTVGKSAVEGYMRSVAAMRLGGLRANAVLPDWIETSRTAPHIGRIAPGGVWADNPMGRTGRPLDCANAALYLLSPAAAYINGVSIEVDGGMRLRSPAWLALTRTAADTSGSPA